MIRTQEVVWPKPGILDSLKSLEWFAQSVSMGQLWGQHKSNRLATGIEFDQYRHYTPGDDIRQLDWKKYARTGKYYLRQSLQDNAHNLAISIDNSKSMTYTEEEMSKLDYAKILTASLTYIAARQGDKFEWTTNSGTSFLKGQGMMHWHRSTGSLFNLEASDHKSVMLDPTINYKEYIWITDLYDDIEEIKQRIKTMSSVTTSLTIVQIMGKKEASLDFGNDVAFIDLETRKRVTLSPKQYKTKYQTAINEHKYNVSQLCYKYGAAYIEISVQDNIRKVVSDILKRAV